MCAETCVKSKHTMMIAHGFLMLEVLLIVMPGRMIQYGAAANQYTLEDISVQPRLSGHIMTATYRISDLAGYWRYA